MQSSHIVKVDSKGRVLIPVDMRADMSIADGTHILVTRDESNGHLRMTPIPKGSMAEVSMKICEFSLMASVAAALSGNSFNIIMSESKRIDEKNTEIRMLVDLSEASRNMDALREILSNIEGVNAVDVAAK